MPVITVRNLQRTVDVDLAALQEFARRAIDVACRFRKRKSMLPSLASIDVLLISDRRIAESASAFPEHRGPTDVITFQHGEIFVSAETARGHARRFGTSTSSVRCVCTSLHGLLHLHGFDDKTAADRRAR